MCISQALCVCVFVCVCGGGYQMGDALNDCPVSCQSIA